MHKEKEGKKICNQMVLKSIIINFRSAGLAFYFIFKIGHNLLM